MIKAAPLDLSAAPLTTEAAPSDLPAAPLTTEAAPSDLPAAPLTAEATLLITEAAPPDLPTAPLTGLAVPADLPGLPLTDVAAPLVLPGLLFATAACQDLSTIAAALLDPQPDPAPSVEDAALPVPVSGTEVNALSVTVPGVDKLPCLSPCLAPGLSLWLLLIAHLKQAFRTETRYILFAHTLLVDLVFLLLTDFVVLMFYDNVLMPMVFCIPFCILMEMVTLCTPLTITAMCVERYVAICMPLRHSALSTSSRTHTAILIIWTVGSSSTSSGGGGVAKGSSSSVRGHSTTGFRDETWKAIDARLLPGKPIRHDVLGKPKLSEYVAKEQSAVFRALGSALNM
ncbi:hypothetical protein P4O66_017562 [Electrophorus voltai]|uniref:G-protein coupled receptors family 1 profile domain-containing protein n=1 Tax=Electrophorus voltai TaxID=2609070 RepID=A0AAD9DM90_9TELE|nr:hypothetical protein P4O66_017562 [Electrophorus voltai]